ncbi:MAG: hypothetical protein RIT03_636 [Bacteroidota bacterium]|jgi:hypothetical protein
MENFYNPVYREEYMQGFELGLNPTLENHTVDQSNKAFHSGFQYGREEYERLNGKISLGIPKHILTDKILEEFMLAGMLGMEIEYNQYNAHQLHIIEQWYKSGIEKYDANETIYLMALLESLDIAVH